MEMVIYFLNPSRLYLKKKKKWVLLDNEDWKEIKNDEGALLYKYKSCIDKFPYRIEIDGKKEDNIFLLRNE